MGNNVHDTKCQHVLWYKPSWGYHFNGVQYPHFGINPKVAKLDAFLQEWSVAPFNQCYEVEKLVSLPALVNEKSMNEFQTKSKESIEQVKQNFHRIINVIEAS